MHELLPHYERELALLQQQAEEFTRRHPHIAGRLSASGELLQDPQVEHLVQSFALLAARVHARLDDDVPEFTHALLERLAPQWLRPLPSCAIARLDNALAAREAATAQVLPAGTVLDSLAAQPGSPCRFTTTAEAQVLPLRVAEAGFSTAPGVPAGSPLPRHATGLLTLRLELSAAPARWGSLGVQHLRLHLAGEAPRAAALREALTRHVAATFVQLQPHGPWQLDAAAQPLPVGLSDAEALLGQEADWPAAQRLLAEWFAFPDKFNFLDLPLPAAASHSEQRTLALHFALTGLAPDGEAARLLRGVSAADWLVNCVPVVNLFDTEAEAQPVPQRPGCYALRPKQDAPAQALHAVTEVRLLPPDGAAADGHAWHLEPWCSLHHGAASVPQAQAAWVPGAWPAPEGGLYWIARREPSVAQPSADAGLLLELVDEAGAPVALPGATVQVKVRAGNGARPAGLDVGRPGGDLCCAGGGSWNAIRLLRPPTPARRADLGRGQAWRLLALLAPKPLSPYVSALEALKDALRLLDLSRSAHTERLLEALTGLDSRPAQACMADRFGPRVVRGTEVRLSVREAAFTGCGLHLFAQLLSRWFAQSARHDSFIRLHLVAADSGELLMSCPRQSGEMPLL